MAACRFFGNGYCMRGSNCTYNHTLCSFFNGGNCRYGNSCRNVHQLSTASRKPLRAKIDGTMEFHAIISSLNDKNVPDEKDSENKRSVSYASAVGKGGKDSLVNRPLCPYGAQMKNCPYGDTDCSFVHGDICPLCSLPALHPYNETQRAKHTKECMLETERDTLEYLAGANSRGKMCSICLEVVLDKHPSDDSGFGILENCRHVFCFSCISNWRKSSNANERENHLSCPECRVGSAFVVRSNVWYEDEEGTQRIIDAYKKRCFSTHCKFFQRGRGHCRFAKNCLYQHTHPDGRAATPTSPRIRRRFNADGEIEYNVDSYLSDLIPWDDHSLLFYESDDSSI